MRCEQNPKITCGVGGRPSQHRAFTLIELPARHQRLLAIVSAPDTLILKMDSVTRL